MKKQNYSDLLKDPRWQKKRLEIMQRDKFMCQECGDTESTLNVHHLSYHPNMNPWDYDNKELQTLCNDCHSSLHDDYQTIKRIAANLNGEVMHYAVDILWKMTFLYPPDCAEILELATELAKINKGENGKETY